MKHSLLCHVHSHTPYAFNYIWGDPPPPLQELTRFEKVSIPPLKINIFQRKKYQKIRARIFFISFLKMMDFFEMMDHFFEKGP